MANFILSSDWHWTDKPDDKYRFGITEWLANQVIKYKIDAIFIAGDLTDSKDRHSAALVNIICERLWTLSQQCPVVLIKGNHDYKECLNPFFGFLGKYKNIHYVSDTSLFEFAGEQVYAIGHQSSREGLVGRLEDVRKRAITPDLVLMHQTVNGSVSSSGYTLEGLDVEVFKGMRCPIWSGDIHVPQKVGPVHYMGSPYTIRFGDEFIPRVVLWKHGKTEDLHYPTITKRVVVISDPEELYNLTLDAGDQVKVRIQLDKSEHSLWAERREAATKILEERGAVLSKVELISTPTDYGKKNKDTPMPTRVTSKQLLTEYCQREGVDAYIESVGWDIFEEIGN